MINWAGLRLQCGLFQNPGSFGIDKIVSAKSRSGGGLRIDQPPQDRIKPWENEIILMAASRYHPLRIAYFDACTERDLASAESERLRKIALDALAEVHLESCGYCDEWGVDGDPASGSNDFGGYDKFKESFAKACAELLTDVEPSMHTDSTNHRSVGFPR